MKTLRTGYTTGTCAAAATKAATLALMDDARVDCVEIELPDGARVEMVIEETTSMDDHATATVIKDAGDDPDVTDGLMIRAKVKWADGAGIILKAGEGVGMVTKKGLRIPAGEPAINPVPRMMIERAAREVTSRGMEIEISIPGGEKIAEKTFNPRLGVVGGLSILGTTGIVRPYSHDAIRESLKCAIDVAEANGVATPIFTAGNIGTRAAMTHFSPCREGVIEVGNEWGYMLDAAKQRDFRGMLVVGHPGKLAKLIDGSWDTHSSKSASAVPVVQKIATELFGAPPDESATVEGVFMSLPVDARKTLADEVAWKIAEVIDDRIDDAFAVSVALVNMDGDIIGMNGECATWIEK